MDLFCNGAPWQHIILQSRFGFYPGKLADKL